MLLNEWEPCFDDDDDDDTDWIKQCMMMWIDGTGQSPRQTYWDGV